VRLYTWIQFVDTVVTTHIYRLKGRKRYYGNLTTGNNSVICKGQLFEESNESCTKESTLGRIDFHEYSSAEKRKEIEKLQFNLVGWISRKVCNIPALRYVQRCHCLFEMLRVAYSTHIKRLCLHNILFAPPWYYLLIENLGRTTTTLQGYVCVYIITHLLLCVGYHIRIESLFTPLKYSLSTWILSSWACIDFKYFNEEIDTKQQCVTLILILTLSGLTYVMYSHFTSKLLRNITPSGTISNVHLAPT